MQIPQEAVFWQQLGEILPSYPRACESTTLRPRDALAWLQRGCSEVRLGFYEAATNSLCTALAFDGRLAKAWMVQAYGFALQHYYIQSQDAIQHALLLNAELAPCAAYIATLLRDEKPEVALDILGVAFDYGCITDEWWRLYISLCGKAGREEEALSALRLYWRGLDSNAH